MGKKKIKTFSVVVRDKSKPAKLQKFYDEIASFCERFSKSKIIYENQSSATGICEVGTVEFKTLFFVKVEYELNGS